MLEREDKTSHKRNFNLSARGMTNGNDVVPAITEVHGCIDTMPMGDHAVVDYAQDGHGNFLREHGLLDEDGYLHGQRGIPNADVLEGLFIDDYFVLDLGRNKTGKAEEKFATSQRAYAADNLYGSPHKDIHGQSDGTLIGAEFTGPEGWARRGLVTVGAPRARRAALSWWTILALSKPRILGQLVHVLVGSWNSIFMYRRPLFVLFATIYDALRLPRDR